MAGRFNNNYKFGGYDSRRKESTSNKYSRNMKAGFVNPYNFVPTDAPKRFIDAEAAAKDKHTGVFSCRLITRTPLSIPDTAEQSGDNAPYPFLTVDGNKIIPGSSLRGVIRSIYETVTNSCMTTVEENDVINARADPKSAFQPSLLIRENEEWNLYSAQRTPLVVREGTVTNGTIHVQGKDYHWGDPVLIDDGNKKRYPSDLRPYAPENLKPGYKKGYLFLGEAFGNKHAEGIFFKENKINGNSSEYIARLDEVYAAYNDSSINRNLYTNANGKKNIKAHYGYQGYEYAKKKGVIPIWYQITAEGKIHLSFAAIGRMVYDNSLSDIDNVGKPCRNRNNLCKACALFGMIGEKSLGSKVRFTDGICVLDSGTVDNVLLKELGSPKPSYLPFYTEEGKDYDQHGIRIRGRKFYWHNPKAASDENVYKGDPKGDTSRSSSVELQNSGAEYTFKVYYDKVTEQQRNELAWALTLGDNDKDGKHCIKIGHSKPLGLGSAKIVIEDAIERNINVEEGTYDETAVALVPAIAAGENAVCTNIGYRELMRITDYTAIANLPIEYPYIDNSKDPMDQIAARNPNAVASHQWFNRNKSDCGLLPHISEPQELHPYHYDPNANGNRESNGYGSRGSSGNSSYSGGSFHGRSKSFSVPATYRPIKPHSKPGK